MSQNAELLDQFLDMLAVERDAAPHTLSAYGRDLRHFLKQLSGDVATVSYQELLHYVESLTVSSSSKSRKISALRQFFAFVRDSGQRLDNPTEGFVTPARARPLPKALTPDIITALFSVAASDSSDSGLRLYAILELLYATGLRANEVVTLKQEHIQNDEIRVVGKGGKERILPLTTKAKSALMSYGPYRECFVKRAPNPYVFPGRSQAGHMTRQHLDNQLKALARAADLPNLSAHMIRHSLATHLLHRGVDLPTVQAILGHADLSTTQIYTHIPDDHLQTVLQDCHPLAIHRNF